MDTDALEYVNCDLCGADDCVCVLEKNGGRYVQCRECGFVYSNPRPVQTGEVNDEYFSENRHRYIARNYSRRKQKRYARQLRGFAKYRKTGRLVEIGSNVGGFIYRAREMGWDPIGIEPVAACAEYAAKEHDLRTFTGTLEEAGIETDSVDVIFSNAVYEHLPSPASVSKTAARILRPGGVIFTKTVNWDSYTRDFLGTEWKLLDPAHHLSLFTPEVLETFFTRQSLETASLNSNGVRISGRSFRGLKKGLFSLCARFSLRGDRIIILSRKPSRQ